MFMNIDPQTRKGLLAFFLLVLLISLEAKAQNEVAIGSATTKSNAILWLKGNGSQGLILPIVTNRTAVSNPDNGMIVFDSSDNKVWYRSNNAWVEVGSGSGASTVSLHLLLQGNQLQLRDGTTVLNSTDIASGMQANGSFMVFNGGSWQYATLIGDVTGANGALQVNGIKGKTITTLPLSAQALVYDPTSNSGSGGWVFQALSATSVNLTGPVTSVGNNTSIANEAITNAMLANPAVANLSGTNTGDQINITGNAATVTTNANLTGPVTSTGNATAIANGAITNAMLTNPAVANLSGTNTGDEVTFKGAGTSGIVPDPGTASGKVLQDNGTWVTPVGSGDMLKSTYDTNGNNVVDIANTVTTNANLTGPVTSTGNVTAIANGAITNAMLANPAVANLSGTNTGDEVVFSSGSEGLVPAPGASTGSVLRDDGTWVTKGSGTVTSVGLSLPSIFTVSNSPVTASGTLTGTLSTQNANTIFAGPSSGLASAPAFRGLVSADIPNLDASKISSGQFAAVQIPSLDATVISSGVLSTAVGGTGFSFSSGSIGQGQLLIGTGGGFAKANLTAGSGINITNGSGSITISGNIYTPGTGISIAGTTITNTGDTDATNDITTATTAGGDLSGNYPNPTIGATVATGGNIITAINAASTLINGARVNTNFGTQAISTTGSLSAGATTITGLTINGAVWPGNANGVLTNNGTGTLSWGTPFTNPMTTSGDIMYGGVGGVANRLATGSGFLKGGAIPSYSAVNLASTDVSGVLPVLNGGTGSTTPAGARTTLGTLGTTLPSGNIFVGNVGGLATGVVMSGDATIDNVGAVKLTNSIGTRTNLGLGGLAVLDAVGSTEITDGSIEGNDLNTNISISTSGNITTTGTGTIFGTGGVSGLAFGQTEGVAIKGTAENNSASSTGLFGVVNTSGNTSPVNIGARGYVDLTAAASTNYGLFGTAIGSGVTNYGVYAIAGGATTNWAGYFLGDLAITGGLAVGASPNFGTSGQVLTSSGPGATPTWSSPLASGWSLTGNALSGGEIIGSTNGNPLPFITNNVERMRIDAAGYVGIGTNAPSFPLHLNNTSATSNYMMITNSGSTNGMLIGNDGSGGKEAFIINRENAAMYFQTNSVNRMAINAAGNVGIGTISPTVALDVVGGIKTSANNITVGSENILVGVGGGSGTANTAMGYGTLYQSTGSSNTGFGFTSFFNNTTGTGNTGFGRDALAGNTTGNFNTAIGASALSNNITGSNNIALGFGADVTTDGLTKATAIGYNAKVAASNSLVLGGTGADVVNVGIGTTTPTEVLDIAGNLKFSGTLLPNNLAGTAGQVLTSGGPGIAPTWVSAGSATGWTISGNAGTTSANYIGTNSNVPLNFRVNSINSGTIDPTLINTFFGYQSGLSNSTGNNNTAIGQRALTNNTTGIENTAVGVNTLPSNNSNYNTAIGKGALFTQTTAGGFGSNTAIGYQGLYLNSAGYQNASLGYLAGYNNQTGAKNTFVGANAGPASALLTGDENTFIGSNAGTSLATLTNSTAIGANAQVTTSNSLVLGSGVNVGIGTTAPVAKLNVQGDVLLTGDNTNVPLAPVSGVEFMTGRSNAGALLAGQTNGDLSFQYGGGGFRHFIQTRHNSVAGSSQNAFDFYLNNSATAAGSVSPNNAVANGNILGMSVTATGVGIGTSAPINKLDVEGGLAVGTSYAGTNTATSNGAIIQGNVGIGATAPVKKLEVVSTALGGDGILINHQTNRPTLYFDNSTTTMDGAVISGTATTDGLIYSFGNATSSLTFYMNMDLTGFHPWLQSLNLNLGTATKRWTNIFLVNNPSVSSDSRLKSSIKETSYGLKQVMSLRPVSYYLKSEKDGNKHLGFIAQEVKTVIPEVVEGNEGEDEFLSMRYSEMIPVLTKAIQEQQTQIESLKAELDKAALENKKLKTKKDLLESKVASFEVQQQAIQKDVEELKRMLNVKASKN